MKLSSMLDRLLDPISRVMRPPPEMGFDFTRPRGEVALIGPDSISWRIFKNPITLFVGGVAAVVMELAEPSVRSGIWEHSSFRRDAVMRLRRTGAAAMMTVYGPEQDARRMIARVARMHERIRGTTPDGIPYQANDRRLLDWVQATASFGFIEAYSRYASPLSDVQRSQAFGEGAVAARLYGATGAPRSMAGWQDLLAETMPRLQRSDIVFEFLCIMNRAPILPRLLRPAQRLFVRAALDIVPPEIRDRLGIEHMLPSSAGRRLVSAAARLADRVPLRSAPPAQACIRLDRDPSFLYR